MAILRVISPERVPKEMFIVGIEGRVFHWLQRGLSPEVREAIPHAVEVISKLIGAPICASLNEWAALDLVALSAQANPVST
jgi:Ni,Fe-hydrogenase maturation factor